MNSAWNCLHITMACFYTAMGILQIAAGVYFLFWARFIHLSGFLWVGSLDTVIGIGGGILACLSEISTSRQKVLLFMSVSVLLINTVNTIVSEYYFSINSLYIRNNKLIHYNPWTYKYAKLTGVLLVVVSFFDALLIFVSYSNLKITNYRRFLETRKAQQQQTAETAAAATATITKKTHKNSGSYDPDLAFVIDTQQTKVKKKLEVLPQETQTNWVFGSRSVSKQDIGTSTNSPITPHKLTAAATTAPTTTTILSNDYFLNNNNTLRTFSRSASPSSMHNLSKTESDFSLDEERQPETIEIEPVPLANKIRKNNPYSNLMAELEKAFENKKKMVAIDGDGGDGGVENTRADSVESLESVSTTSSSKQLCRELEAVLQSIEHLDSPENEENDGDGDGDGDGEDDDDKGTCDYEYGSKTSLTTSGYSSPTGQKPIPNLNYSISTNPKNNATIISLTTTTSKQPEETATTKVFKSVTEIKTDYEMAANVAKKVESLPQPSYDVKVDDGRKNRLFSFLGQKKRPDINKLSKKTFFLPEVENAILKSETLAFLTRDQLLAKLDQNVAIRRKIEQKVQQQKQQLGHIVSESHC